MKRKEGGFVMEYRKIIKFGNSSHVVSLPHEWLEKNKLNKGDTVYFSENGNNELVLSPQLREIKDELKEISIDVSGKDFDQINREIISAYMRDYNIIKLHGNDIKQKAELIRRALHGLIALEIMEQTKDNIVARDFLNIKNTSLRDLARKTDIIIRTMIADTKLCFEEDHSSSINNRDIDINRLTYLAFRIIRKASKNPEIMKYIEAGPLNLTDTWTLMAALERIADDTKRASRWIAKIGKKNRFKNDIMRILEDIESTYLNTMKSYHTDNRKLAVEVAGHIKSNLLPKCNKVLAREGCDINIVNCIEKLKGSANHIKEMARTIYISED